MSWPGCRPLLRRQGGQEFFKTFGVLVQISLIVLAGSVDVVTHRQEQRSISTRNDFHPLNIQCFVGNGVLRIDGDKFNTGFLDRFPARIHLVIGYPVFDSVIFEWIAANQAEYFCVIPYLLPGGLR